MSEFNSPSGQKNRSFMEMIKSAKDSTQDDDLEDEEELVFKKESTSPIHKGSSPNISPLLIKMFAELYHEMSKLLPLFAYAINFSFYFWFQGN